MNSRRRICSTSVYCDVYGYKMGGGKSKGEKKCSETAFYVFQSSRVFRNVCGKYGEPRPRLIVGCFQICVGIL